MPEAVTAEQGPEPAQSEGPAPQETSGTLLAGPAEGQAGGLLPQALRGWGCRAAENLCGGARAAAGCAAVPCLLR